MSLENSGSSEISGSKVIITGCTKNKNPSGKASEVYKGAIFNSIKQYSELNGLPYFILSAKYGFLNPDQYIESYDCKLQYKAQHYDLVSKILNEQRLFLNYLLGTAEIELFLSQKYEDVIIELLCLLNYKGKVIRLKKKNGIFDFKKNLSLLLKGERNFEEVSL